MDLLLDGRLKVRPLCMPDVFVEQAKPEAMNALAGLDRAGIVAAVFDALGRKPMAIGAAE